MYSKAVMASHLYVPASEVNYREARSLCFVENKYDGPSIEMQDESCSGWFGFPRHTFSDPERIARQLIDKRGAGDEIEIDFKSDFREGQERVFRMFERAVDSGVTGFILQAAPGFGKTVSVIAMLAHLKKTALVVVPRSNLVQQWKDRLVEHSSLCAEDIGTAVSGKLDAEGKKVVIGLVHSVALDRFGVDFRKQFGVVVFDEVDRSVPPATFAPVVAMFPAKYRIGVSATLKRQDGLHVVFQKHIGECFLSGRADRLKPKVLVHEFAGNSGFVPPKLAKLNRRGMLLSRVASNPARNLVLCEYIRLIYNSGRRCVVLSDRKDQLMAMREICAGQFNIPEAVMGFYVRSLNGKKLKEQHLCSVAKDCDVIFATYGMFALGTDIVDLSGLIYATPQSEIEQSKGRIERILAGKKQPVIVDFIDTYYKDARRWGSKRRWIYDKQNLSVKVIGG